jgi:hypothetical protein
MDMRTPFLSGEGDRILKMGQIASRHLSDASDRHRSNSSTKQVKRLCNMQLASKYSECLARI